MGINQLLIYYLNDDSIDTKQTYTSTAYRAYITINKANNIYERKQLLNLIIKCPHSCYLFIRNCNPNEDELELALKTIKTDIISSYNAFCYCEMSINKKYELFNVVIENNDYAFELIKNHSTTSHEKSLFYLKYKHLYFNHNLDILSDFCIALKDIISENDKETLINMIYKEQDMGVAKKVLNSDISISNNFKDILESIIIIKNLI